MSKNKTNILFFILYDTLSCCILFVDSSVYKMKQSEISLLCFILLHLTAYDSAC